MTALSDVELRELYKKTYGLDPTPQQLRVFRIYLRDVEVIL